MVWSLETSCGFESDKIAAHVVQYTMGRGLDIGCGARKVWPHVIGFDNGHHSEHFGQQCVADISGSAHDLSMFADESMNFIYSSHTLEHIPEDKVQDVLREWTRVLKKNGYLTLYVPSANLYPKVGEQGANPDHKWNIFPGDIEKHLIAATSCGWTQLECEERGLPDAHPYQMHEYSLFEVYQKRDDGEFVKKVWQRNPEGKKRCLVIRYGAIGDQIVVSSILPLLKKKGYHLTYCTTPPAKEILWHDPHIDEWLLQEKDQVPNVQLGAYWKTLTERYDHIINLCESVEDSLLISPNKLTHDYSQEARRKLFNVNYLERTHDIAGVPHEFAPCFYATKEEKEKVRSMRAKNNGPVIAWLLNGSSPHKVYPWVQIVIAWLMERTNAHVYLMADPKIGLQLQTAVIEKLKESNVDISRVHPTAGDWPIRKVLSFVKYAADIVVGPETGPLNAVGHEAQVAKIIYLSHSSHENLTKHWVNTTVIEPDTSKAACYPCHQLHYDWTYCPQDNQTAAALCASAIAPERIFKSIIRILKMQDNIPKEAA